MALLTVGRPRIGWRYCCNSIEVSIPNGAGTMNGVTVFYFFPDAK